MISPGRHRHDEHDNRHPAKPDRWVVGLLAGAALIYLAGKMLGLGKPRQHDTRPNPTH